MRIWPVVLLISAIVVAATFFLTQTIYHGEIQYGRTLGGTTFQSSPIDYSLYILGHLVVIIIGPVMIFAILKIRRKDRIQNQKAANEHIASIGTSDAGGSST